MDVEIAAAQAQVELAECSGRLRQAKAHLVEVQARQERAVVDHGAAEKAATKQIAAVGKAMAARRDRLAAATTAAEAAQGVLWDEARVYDALVVQSAAELRAAGLVARWEDYGTVLDFETGATPADELVVEGRW